MTAILLKVEFSFAAYTSVEHVSYKTHDSLFRIDALDTCPGFACSILSCFRHNHCVHYINGFANIAIYYLELLLMQTFWFIML